MIIMNMQVVELAEGYQVIQDFLDTMRSEWLPGFERSYQRRSKEYQEAMQKHENRGLFLRTLLRKPKKPNRLPARYPADVEERLLADWRGSFTEDGPAGFKDFPPLDEVLGEDFLALDSLRLENDLVIDVVVIGPPGIILVEEIEEIGSELSQPEHSISDVRSSIVDIIQGSEAADVCIYAGSRSHWQENLREIAVQNVLDPQTVWVVTDTLLARHQELSESQTYSALESAEKLTAREKDNFLRMAATL